MLRQAVQSLVLPAAVFLGARYFVGNGDALLASAVAFALLEARRRWKSFEACAPLLRRRTGRWPAWTRSGRLAGEALELHRPS
jgi:hypothetical protein